MKNCRSQLPWQCVQLIERAIRRVVERQVDPITPELPVHVVLVSPGSAAASSSGCNVNHIVIDISWIASEVSSSPAVVVTK